jgi:uncharacterized protein
MAASPPTIILLFPDVLQVLTVASESTAAVIFEVERSRFFAHGIAEFMLDCWCTLYYADAAAAARLASPARAAECYRWLSQSLWTWSARDAERCAMRSPSLSFFPLHRWPHKFSHFLQDHPEIDLWPQSFLQTALSVSRTHTPFWPNLLLGFTDDKIVVLCDQYDGCPSKYGLEAMQGVNLTVTEIDIETVGTNVTIEGEGLDYDALVKAIESTGAVVHSIDQIVAEKEIVEMVSRKR